MSRWIPSGLLRKNLCRDSFHGGIWFFVLTVLTVLTVSPQTVNPVNSVMSFFYIALSALSALSPIKMQIVQIVQCHFIIFFERPVRKFGVSCSCIFLVICYPSPNLLPTPLGSMSVQLPPNQQTLRWSHGRLNEWVARLLCLEVFLYCKCLLVEEDLFKSV